MFTLTAMLLISVIPLVIIIMLIVAIFKMSSDLTAIRKILEKTNVK